MTIAQDFDQFWAAYPRRVGKLAALKAYKKARTQASAEEILAGLEAYTWHMPQEAQFRPHPATWLNQGRWLDEYPERQPAVLNAQGEDWFTECQRIHQGACGGRVAHDTQMYLDKQKAGRQIPARQTA